MNKVRNWKFIDFPRNKMPTKLDQRRLRDGQAALCLKPPNTEAEIVAQINQLHDAIAAMQSLDDLGPEANDAAMRDNDILLEKLRILEVRYEEFRAAKKIRVLDLI
jgi:hypothetical protein